MPFVKGQSGNPGGKKAGIKDKKWATLQYWFEKLTNDIDGIPVTERVKAELKMIELILAKKSLPQDVQESVESVDQTMRLLKEFETKNADRTREESNKAGLDDRKTPIQAEPSAKRD